MQSVKAFISGVFALPLVKGHTPHEQVTCTLANTDYPAQTAPPTGAKYVMIYCSSMCYVAMGEATVTATLGWPVAAGVPTPFPYIASATAAYNLPHVQSPTAGAVVCIAWGKDY